MNQPRTLLALLGKKIVIFTAITSAFLLLVAGFMLFSPQQPAAAVNLDNFKPGDIMSDAVMSNKSTMTKAEINNFLKSKASSCTSKGPFSNGSYYIDKLVIKNNGTRAETNSGKVWWHVKDGHFVCMAEASFGGKSAADIIHKAAQDYSINPQVLIVLLQKEQGLITDGFPNSQQYNTATGFGCPDNADCDADYFGLEKQIRKASALFREVLDGGWTNYPVGMNYIQYNPAASCGGSNVNIANRATSSLYRYTPYQPNQAALNAGYGTAPCGAYGNRNFYLYFTDWFGGTHDDKLNISRDLWVSPGSLHAIQNKTISVSFKIKNTSGTARTISSIGVAVRDADKNNLNFPFVSVTLRPGESYEYFQRRSFDDAGKYNMWISAKLPGGYWSRSWPYSAPTVSVRDQVFTIDYTPNITQTRNIYFSRSNTYTTEDLSAASVAITNNEHAAAIIPSLKLRAVHESGDFFDFPTVKNINIEPGDTYEYFQRRVLSKAGKYNLRVMSIMPKTGEDWLTNYPQADSLAISPSLNINILEVPKVNLVRDLYVSPDPILVGQNVGASYVIKNNSADIVSIKELSILTVDDLGNKKYFPSVENITIQPGQKYKYYEYSNIPTPGKHTFTVIAKINSDLWTTNWPINTNNSTKSKVTLKSRLPKLYITRNAWHSPVNSKIHQTKAMSFVITNKDSRPIVIPRIGMAVRDRSGANVNFPFTSDEDGMTVEPGESYEYYKYRTFNNVGNYRTWIAAKLPWGGWSNSWPYSDDKNIDRTPDFRVVR